jgi:hypothetical protein
MALPQLHRFFSPSVLPILRRRSIFTALSLVAVACLSIGPLRAQDLGQTRRCHCPACTREFSSAPGDLPEFKKNILDTAHGKVVQKLMQKEWQQMRPELEAFAALDLSNPDAKTVAQYFKPSEGRNIAWV